MLEELFEAHLETIRAVNTGFKRYLYAQIDFNTRLMGIIGARGVGKTTLLLQYYKENFNSPEQCLYISADHITVAAIGLYEIAREFFKSGGRTLLVDEIHKYKNWSQELKNIYDTYPNGQVFISGSSTLDILKGKGDLSRRIVLQTLKGLSFREYLILQTGHQWELYPLRELLQKHVQIAQKISSGMPVIKHFRDYLKHGYYPFYLEGLVPYSGKLENIIEKIIYEDIPAVFDVKPSSLHLLKKIIYLVATSQPFAPNIEKISSQLSVSKEYVYHYLECLERARLFSFLRPFARGLKLMRKPEKIYLDNSNLIHAIVGKHGFRSETGAVRETFFLNQVSARHPVFWTTPGDFLADSCTFEIGGKAKTGKQIQAAKNAWVVADDIEIGAKNKIPLWLFGFLY